MPRRILDPEDKKPISGRIQYVMEQWGGSVTGFRTKASNNGAPELASTCRKWVPGPDLGWRWDNDRHRWSPPKDRSERNRVDDWKFVRLPEAALLREFCNLTKASADYILFRESAPYRGEKSTPINLNAELAQHVARALKGRGIDVDSDPDSWLNPEGLFQATVEMAARQVVYQHQLSTIGIALDEGRNALAGFSGTDGAARPGTIKHLFEARKILLKIARSNPEPQVLVNYLKPPR